MANERDKGLGAFLKTLRNHPVLDRDEEHRLALHYRDTRDPATARKLVEGHLRLVVKIARSCCFRRSSLLDLIQEGNLGLMRAVTKYDPDRGVRLSSYAAWWIRAYIYQYIMDNARLMRTVTTFPQRKLFFALRREEARMSAAGQPVEPQVVAGRLGVSVNDVMEMRIRMNREGMDVDLSVLEQPGRDGLVESPLAADEALADGEIRRAVSLKIKAIEGELGSRERLILRERLTADEPISLQEIGRRCGVSRERARQLEQGLKEQLTPYLAPLMGHLSEAGQSKARPQTARPLEGARAA